MAATLLSIFAANFPSLAACFVAAHLAFIFWRHFFDEVVPGVCLLTWQSGEAIGAENG